MLGGTLTSSELLFLGTGAAEGVPAMYCRCPACQGARERGGREIRTRSSLRVGLHHQIDVSPDLYGQMLAAGSDMFDVDHVLVTHTHEDHFAPTMLFDKKMSRQTSGRPVSVYLSKPAKVYVEGLVAGALRSRKERAWVEENIPLIGLDYFGEYEIGGLAIQTVKGRHPGHGPGECSINYLVGMPDGRKFLYACDTGYYDEETWSFLAGRRVDILILECTFAGKSGEANSSADHLRLESFLMMLERMRRIGFIDESTAIYATHFNPHQGLSHFELEDRLLRSPYRAAAAYDGLRIAI
jgi:phosphoribosyl 1,2-cyclic phosphate phosphodiesterase